MTLCADEAYLTKAPGDAWGHLVMSAVMPTAPTNVALAFHCCLHLHLGVARAALVPALTALGMLVTQMIKLVREITILYHNILLTWVKRHKPRDIVIRPSDNDNVLHA